MAYIFEVSFLLFAILNMIPAILFDFRQLTGDYARLVVCLFLAHFMLKIIGKNCLNISYVGRVVK